MEPVKQELRTPHEAARWFRRSTSWIRHQRDLIRLQPRGGQPLFHVRVCRAYVLGKMIRLNRTALRNAQIQALAADCDLRPPALVAREREALHLPPKPRVPKRIRRSRRARRAQTPTDSTLRALKPE